MKEFVFSICDTIRRIFKGEINIMSIIQKYLYISHVYLN